MNISFLYGNSVLNLPMEKTVESLAAAEADFVRVLIFAAAYPAGFDSASAAETLGMDEAQIVRALCYWEQNGVLSMSDTSKKAKKKEKKKSESTVLSNDALPEYTSDELAAMVDKSEALEALIAACQQTVGKIFSVPETRIIVGLYDFLGLCEEYILTLCAWCTGRGKTSLRYIEKTAVALYNKGIDDPQKLNVHLKDIEKYESAQEKIRRLFGIGERALTSYEKKYLENWLETWQMPMELVELAYELTVKNTDKASIPYASKILENWEQMGIKTKEEALAVSEKGSQKETKKDHSFDIDEFSSAAMSRKKTAERGEE